MEIPPDMYEPSPKFMKNSPVKTNSIKTIQEPEIEESPAKSPIKKQKLGLNVVTNFNIEKKKVPVSMFGRVQSHSTSRSKDVVNPNSFVRKLFDDGEGFSARSFSRDVPGRSNFQPESEKFKDKEIEILNHKIRNLIRDKFEIKSQLDSQNHIIKCLKQMNKKKNYVAGIESNSVENSILEVTFKPYENLEDSIKKHKRFPREVFRLPKHKGTY
ncbi:hypothetical protein SteCoe_7183 [Stentor coeruleus]|uniref:Uncharacterized protein n=1 Tax=Stentor coeruleus TaxID=5963 RepID=A0A1R2CNG9_9CILI|nr:hypothetical protein SteCoe_7183 [Stentor coeruleus]